MKLSIITATAVAVLSSSTSAWTLRLFDHEGLTGRTLTFKGMDSKRVSLCVEPKYKEGKSTKTMTVKSLAFGSDRKDKDLQCCIWAHPDDKCAAGKGESNASGFSYECDGFVSVYGFARWMPLLTTAKSFQVSCHPANKAPPKKPPRFRKNIGRMNAKPVFSKNCLVPSKCGWGWTSWLPGDDCQQYCYGKGDFHFGYMSGEGCEGLLNLGKKKCCCSNQQITSLLSR
jgi:hypothetical protein